MTSNDHIVSDVYSNDIMADIKMMEGLCCQRWVGVSKNSYHVMSLDTSYAVKRISEVPVLVNVIRLYQMHVSASAVMLGNHPDIQLQPFVIR